MNDTIFSTTESQTTSSPTDSNDDGASSLAFFESTELLLLYLGIIVLITFFFCCIVIIYLCVKVQRTERKLVKMEIENEKKIINFQNTLHSIESTRSSHNSRNSHSATLGQLQHHDSSGNNTSSGNNMSDVQPRATSLDHINSTSSNLYISYENSPNYNIGTATNTNNNSNNNNNNNDSNGSNSGNNHNNNNNNNSNHNTGNYSSGSKNAITTNLGNLNFGNLKFDRNSSSSRQNHGQNNFESSPLSSQLTRQDSPSKKMSLGNSGGNQLQLSTQQTQQFQLSNYNDLEVLTATPHTSNSHHSRVDITSHLNLVQLNKSSSKYNKTSNPVSPQPSLHGHLALQQLGAPTTSSNTRITSSPGHSLSASSHHNQLQALQARQAQQAQQAQQTQQGVQGRQGVQGVQGRAQGPQGPQGVQAQQLQATPLKQIDILPLTFSQDQIAAFQNGGNEVTSAVVSNGSVAGVAGVAGNTVGSIGSGSSVGSGTQITVVGVDANTIRSALTTLVFDPKLKAFVVAGNNINNNNNNSKNGGININTGKNKNQNQNQNQRTVKIIRTINSGKVDGNDNGTQTVKDLENRITLTLTPTNATQTHLSDPLQQDTRERGPTQTQTQTQTQTYLKETDISGAPVHSGDDMENTPLTSVDATGRDHIVAVRQLTGNSETDDLIVDVQYDPEPTTTISEADMTDPDLSEYENNSLNFDINSDNENENGEEEKKNDNYNYNDNDNDNNIGIHKSGNKNTDPGTGKMRGQGLGNHDHELKRIKLTPMNTNTLETVPENDKGYEPSGMAFLTDMEDETRQRGNTGDSYTNKATVFDAKDEHLQTKNKTNSSNNSHIKNKPNLKQNSDNNSFMVRDKNGEFIIRTHPEIIDKSTTMTGLTNVTFNAFNTSSPHSISNNNHNKFFNNNNSPRGFHGFKSPSQTYPLNPKVTSNTLLGWGLTAPKSNDPNNNNNNNNNNASEFSKSTNEPSRLGTVISKSDINNDEMIDVMTMNDNASVINTIDNETKNNNDGNGDGDEKDIEAQRLEMADLLRNYSQEYIVEVDLGHHFGRTEILIPPSMSTIKATPQINDK